jgi:hypothetical protein
MAWANFRVKLQMAQCVDHLGTAICDSPMQDGTSQAVIGLNHQAELESCITLTHEIRI